MSSPVSILPTKPPIPNDELDSFAQEVNRLGTIAYKASRSRENWTDEHAVDYQTSRIVSKLFSFRSTLNLAPDSELESNPELYTSEALLGEAVVRIMRLAADQQLDLGSAIKQALQ